MAMYNNFPASYNNGYNNPQYTQTYQPPQMQMYNQPYNYNQPTTPVTTNNNSSGFVRVQNENEARLYPVAPGNSVSFIDENLPYVYTKTVDTSQLDRPKFEKYRLVKEDSEYKEEEKPDMSAYALKDDVSASIKELTEKIEELSKQMNKSNNNNRR